MKKMDYTMKSLAIHRTAQIRTKAKTSLESREGLLVFKTLAIHAT